MSSWEGLTLQEKALAALKNSTKMLRVASALRKQGNTLEADRLQNEARAQRTISTLLMAEAQNREVVEKLSQDGARNTAHDRGGDSFRSH